MGRPPYTLRLLGEITCAGSSAIGDYHKKSFSGYVLDWGGMVATLAKAGSSNEWSTSSFQTTIQDLLHTRQIAFSGHPFDWEAVVTGLVNDSAVSKPMFRYLLESSIANRLERIGLGKWSDKMIDGTQQWGTHDEREGRVKSMFSKLASYEHQNEVTSLLELALWKGKIYECHNSNNPTGLNNPTDVETRQRKKAKRDRQQCRIRCGAEIILPNVVPYLFGKKKQDVAKGSANNGEVIAMQVTSPVL